MAGKSKLGVAMWLTGFWVFAPLLTLFAPLLTLGQDRTGSGDELARVYHDLGSRAQDEGRYADADRYYRRAIGLWSSGHALPQLGLARTLNNLSSLLWETGRQREAEPLLERSARLHLQYLGSEHPGTATTFSNLGKLYLRQGRWKEAEEAFRQSLSSGASRNRAEIAWDFYALGVIGGKMRRAAEAGNLFRKAQAIWELRRQEGEAEPKELVSLAVSYRHTGTPERMEPLLREAVAEEEAAARRGSAAPARARAFLYMTCAREFRALGRKAEAKELDRQARQLLSTDEQYQLFAETIHIQGLLAQ